MIQLMKINSFINKMIDQQLFIIIIIFFTSLHYVYVLMHCRLFSVKNHRHLP